MSTITITPTITPWTEPRPARVIVRPTRARRTNGNPGRLRLTRRGRVVVVAGFLMVLGALMIALGPMATGALHAGTPEPVRIVVVHPGDTLYDIAGSVAAPGHVNEMIAHIEQLNALNSPVIQPGQKIAVPASDN
ncbi:MAG TPA: LysM peptidoglycan-binding domain-containing protein [Marmoricola sp.]